MFVIISHDVRIMFEKEWGGGGAARLNGSDDVLLYGSYCIVWMHDL
jgi:hypothetical protein